MQILRTLLLFGVICLGLLPALSAQNVGGSSWRCRAQPVEPCFEHHGRLSSQNGIALKIWLIGTTRVVRVDNDVDDIPPLVGKYLEMASPDHSYIYGDFDICPLAPDQPGHVRPVCVTDARRLVVQNLRRSQPAFRLLPTWPTGTRQAHPTRPGETR
jgi:hypothetical protein